jgi:hypothetical protein
MPIRLYRRRPAAETPTTGCREAIRPACARRTGSRTLRRGSPPGARCQTFVMSTGRLAGSGYAGFMNCHLMIRSHRPVRPADRQPVARSAHVPVPEQPRSNNHEGLHDLLQRSKTLACVTDVRWIDAGRGRPGLETGSASILFCRISDAPQGHPDHRTVNAALHEVGRSGMVFLYFFDTVYYRQYTIFTIEDICRWGQIGVAI